MTMGNSKKAIPFLMAGVVISVLVVVLKITAELPLWVTAGAVIISVVSVAYGVYLVVKSKKQN